MDYGLYANPGSEVALPSFSRRDLWGLFFNVGQSTKRLAVSYPVLPLVIVFAVQGVQRLWERGNMGRILALSLVGSHVISCFFIFPDYLAYFNSAWGGPEEGHRVLVNSDLDWGQDLKRYRDYQEHTPQNDIQVALYTEMVLDAYGIKNSRPMDFFPSTGSILISIPYLTNALSPIPDRSWLLNQRPKHVFGYTLFLYEVTEEDLKNRYTHEAIAAFKWANKAHRLRITDPSAAEASLKKAIDRYPQCWQIHQFAAQFYADHGCYDKADKFLESGAALHPEGKIPVLNRNGQ